MTNALDADAFLAKALENLASAESEFAAARYNACANRCYYACFQAAVAALMRAGVQPRGAKRVWAHGFVQAEFAGQLIARRKLYSAELRGVLSALIRVRELADYEPEPVGERQARRALYRARMFVGAIVEKEASR